MTRETFNVQGPGGVELHAMKWYDASAPKAIVQIAHGMAEHIGRYDAFANELLSHNIFVYGHDHRGHGLTARAEEDQGYFADESGFEHVTADLYEVTKHIQSEYPDVPVLLFGHSMGSFLARRYAQLHGGELHGLILSGTGDNASFMLKIGKIIAALEGKRKGRRAKSELLHTLSFGQFNKAFRPNRTPFDWLSRDEGEVDAYIEDPHCGGVCTAGFFYDLYEGLQVIANPANIAGVPKALPIFLISGDRDPVGGNTKGVLRVYEAFRTAGIEDVSYKFYEGARHEVLNETNRDEVYEDVVTWIEKHL